WNVVGDTSVDNPEALVGPLTTGADVVPDPLKDLAAPTAASAVQVHAGGLSISGGTVTLAPGLHYVDGNLTITRGAPPPQAVPFPPRASCSTSPGTSRSRGRRA